MAETISLEFLAGQQRRILDEMQGPRTEMAALRIAHSPTRDDITVLTAMATRQDRKLDLLADLLRDVTAQLNRVEARVGRLEEHLPGQVTS